ncbi:uncharacterized protein N7459_002372 [Penicillium hispanicum]|uniref:uncharacterized protein n=1 Tax=Penicillium hispanicum TaxID=1080232 RepID=UPI0025401247|nr:uncharacterized protein N7459_002372 [Penicillium hispanicum]KAJ5592003.1 hypothetical protein N7459_002372 [Penicillium hispanicum]
MPGQKKRKRAPVDGSEDDDGANGFGVGQILPHLQPTSPTDTSVTTPDGTTQPSTKRKRVDGEKTKYPELTFVDGKLQSQIHLYHLQNLLLYCFADGIAPQWISVKHSGHMRKAVVLMVPGLEIGMFDGTVLLEPVAADANNTNHSQPGEAERSAVDQKAADFERWKQGKPLEDRSRLFNPRPLRAEALPKPLRVLAELFPLVWPVKAPGDTKYNKLHSPLQAMLLSALPKSKDSKAKSKGPQPPRVDKGFANQRTPITKFISTAEELRDAEYPLHPALFSTEEERAENAEFRRRNRQSAEDGWVDTDVPSLEAGDVPESEIQKGSMTAGRYILSLDCEMCLNDNNEQELARISMVNWDGEVVVDELVKPARPVINYLTQYSGITQQMLDPVTTTLFDIQTRLRSLITPRTILVGHSLNSDLSALKMTHPFIVDTSMIYPHARGPPLRNSLKFLSTKYLSKEIQKSSHGHDSVEDAVAVLDLVKQKCEKGERWGTSDASNESIFRRLARSAPAGKTTTPGEGRTGAVVDWGNPERGFGAQASVSIGCSNDDDVVKGIAAVTNGDESNPAIPGGGVDVTWARLRNLERFRGWANRLPDANNENRSAAVGPEGEIKSTVQSNSITLAETVARTASDISRIYESLPPCTLFMVYSGTGDPQELNRLQEMHKQFRAEFHAKKPWDELSVKWTDTEEQALKKACERARAGCAFMCVK